MQSLLKTIPRMKNTSDTCVVVLRKKNIGHGWLRMTLLYKKPVIDPKTGMTMVEEDLGVSVIESPQTQSQERMNMQIEEACATYQAKRSNEIARGILKHIDHDLVSYYQFVASAKTTNYTAGFKHFKSYSNGSWSFALVSAQMCIDYDRYLSEEALNHAGKHLHPGTIRIYSRQLRHIISLAIKEGYIKEFDLYSIPYMLDMPDRRTGADDSQIMQMLATPPPNRRIDKLVRFIMKANVRVGAALGLKWTDIHLDENGRLYFTNISANGRHYADESALEIISPIKKRGRIFEGLEYLSAKRMLKDWSLKSGVCKEIQFDDLRVY